MLYDGALRFCRAGREAMVHGKLYEQNDNLQKAQRIITELMGCLDMVQGGEIAQNLFALYSFSYNELVMANVEDNPEGIDRAVKVLENLRLSWSELEAMQRQGANDNHAEATEKAA